MGFLDGVHQHVPIEAFSEGEGCAPAAAFSLHPVSHVVPEVAVGFSCDASAKAAVSC